MQSFIRGESSQTQQSSSSFTDSSTPSDLADGQQLGLARRFGIAEVEFETESVVTQYPLSGTVTGFAPSTDYFEEIAEFSFPNIQTSMYSIVKRAFDVAFALLTLAISSPVLLLIAIAIKVSSPGPVLFLQERIGLNGKPFKMLKFRSMYVNDRCDTHHTAIGDPRITKVGALLRGNSLDELPQFINVLKGDMSVVGPRPELTHFVQRFRQEIPSYMARHRGKCGITGWAQINGLCGSDTSIARRIEYDIEYLTRWSFGWDMKIIIITVVKGFIRNAF